MKIFIKDGKIDIVSVAGIILMAWLIINMFSAGDQPNELTNQHHHYTR